MSDLTTILGWFCAGRVPATAPRSAIIIGGTELLREFLARVDASRSGGRLVVASAFVGKGIQRELRSWDAMPHSLMDLTIVTSTRRDARTAADEIGPLPWRSMTIRIKPRLHAKLFAFLDRDGAGLCLVGSHNLTLGGAASNDEAGVLFTAPRDSDLLRAVHICEARVQRLAEQARACFDLLDWPPRKAA